MWLHATCRTRRKGRLLAPTEFGGHKSMQTPDRGPGAAECCDRDLLHASPVHSFMLRVHRWENACHRLQLSKKPLKACIGKCAPRRIERALDHYARMLLQRGKADLRSHHPGIPGMSAAISREREDISSESSARNIMGLTQSWGAHRAASRSQGMTVLWSVPNVRSQWMRGMRAI